MFRAMNVAVNDSRLGRLSSRVWFCIDTFSCLACRESVAQEKIKEAHRRVMTANHPDAGGSDYLAAKINEAKDHLLGQTRGSGSAF